MEEPDDNPHRGIDRPAETCTDWRSARLCELAGRISNFRPLTESGHWGNVVGRDVLHNLQTFRRCRVAADRICIATGYILLHKYQSIGALFS